MKLTSRDILRALVGPEEDKKMSARTLARYTGKHPSFIDHLLAGRRNSCEPKTAERIAEALDVPIGLLFVPHLPSTTSRDVQHQASPGERMSA
ncbi:helix-turn-helix domain-containing protein [Cellulomonas soli]|uniref:helix-turn-helix domain-containing protein n=1 Tax=Cellulomonas soli TaxID=931535 RepID=UPI003F84B8FA